jgi:hypothetical protein
MFAFSIQKTNRKYINSAINQSVYKNRYDVPLWVNRWPFGAYKHQTLVSKSKEAFNLATRTILAIE